MAVVDLKFGGRAVREKELQENRPLQLAIYGHLLRCQGQNPWPASAFFITESHGSGGLEIWRKGGSGKRTSGKPAFAVGDLRSSLALSGPKPMARKCFFH